VNEVDQLLGAYLTIRHATQSERRSTQSRRAPPTALSAESTRRSC
jgi:hypothetical protein